MSRFDDFFRTFNLKLSEKYPKDSKIYLYADYFELVSLFNGTSTFTPGEMLDRLADEGILHQTENSEDQAEQNDKEEAFVREVFKLLMQRASSFGDDYPFNIQNENLSFKDDRTAKCDLYIFLLLASNLNLFKPFQPVITKEFELVSTEALKNYLPSFAIVKKFGKCSEYQGYARDKISELALEMGIDVDEEYLDTIAAKGTQELGLDVVAWLPLVDKIGNYISIFGQCSCGKNWNEKLNETRRYNKFLKVYLSGITHSFFVPYSLMNYNNSTFFEHHEFGEPILLFERQRILSLINNDNVFNGLSSKDFIEQCVLFNEDIV